MTGKVDRTNIMASRNWGLQPDQLASKSTIFRPDLLKGKRIVISGGGSGMGRAAMFLALRLGGDVMICGRDEEKLKRAADAAHKFLDRSPHISALTIRDPDAVTDLAENAFDMMGGVDSLINSAGGQFPQESIDMSVKGWNAVIDTNLNGTFWMMQAFARQWRRRKEPGNIVTVTMVTDRGVPQSAHSCAARAGVHHLAKSLAIEWAPLGIRVNCLAPGAIETEGLNNYPESLLEWRDKSNPMRVMGDSWDIAEGIIFLCSSAAKFINGETLYVDGGARLYGENWPLGKPHWYKDT